MPERGFWNRSIQRSSCKKMALLVSPSFIKESACKKILSSAFVSAAFVFHHLSPLSASPPLLTLSIGCSSLDIVHSRPEISSLMLSFSL